MNHQPNHNNVSLSTFDDNVRAVDILELASHERRSTLREVELDTKKQEVNPRELTKEEEADVEKKVAAIEEAERVGQQTNAAGNEEKRQLSSLPHSYRLIRNLLWIEKNPVYKTALAEWENRENVYASRIGRKSKRRGGLKNDIYNVIGFYSVFQGVLLTATSQSNYLHCLNVGLPISLSLFAWFGTLVHIGRKFKEINDLQTTINSEEIPLREVKSRIQALREKGEAFRFQDFLEDKPTHSDLKPKSYIWVFRAQDLVIWAIVLFSLVFVIAHPLILCRPGRPPSSS